MPSATFAHDLVEEAVFLALSGPSEQPIEEVRRWQQEREAVYERPSAERDRAFRALAQRWWTRLDLSEPLRTAVRLCPALESSPGTLLVRRVARPKDEGCQVFRPRDGGAARTVLTLRAELFATPGLLGAFALEELLYADDMLREEFGYRPALPVPATDLPRREALRERLRTLWSWRNRLRASALLGAKQDTQARGASWLPRERWNELLRHDLSYDELLTLAVEGAAPAASQAVGR